MKLSAIVLAGSLLLPATGATAQGVTDAQIASIVVTANQVDIDAGKVAKEMGSSADVKKFAEQMITDHTGVNKQAVELVTKLKVTPEDNPTSQSLKAGGEKNVANLKTLKGAAFDKAYIDHEVAYHQQVIDALDKTLIPGAKNAELKALLVKVRPAFVAHLEHAKQIQSSLAKTVFDDACARSSCLAPALRVDCRRLESAAGGRVVTGSGSGRGDRRGPAQDAHGHHRGHQLQAGESDRRRRGQSRLGEQGSVSSHGDVHVGWF